MSSKTANQVTSRARITDRDIDFCMNRLITAITDDLGRPFVAGGCRNFRSVISDYSPLQSKDESTRESATFARDYLISNLLDRFIYSAELSEGSAREALAREKFLLNIQRGCYFNEAVMQLDEWTETIIASAATKIAELLGDLDIDEIFRLSVHGPNATRGVKWADAYQGTKFTSFDGTSGAQDLFWNHYLPRSTTEAEELWATLIAYDIQDSATPVPGNIMSFVPKNWKIYRTMSAEPTLNMYFQLGVGYAIARRLKRAGIELASQPECHKALTLIASAFPETGIATVDWSEASDRIWVALVGRLFVGAPDWYQLLLALRSPVTEVDGEQIPLPMISTMGNGFTFALQTLIFWAVCSAISDTVAHLHDDLLCVSVFGDDCIVPSCIVPLIDQFAVSVGWKMNADKSYADGWFRESCGMHAYRGGDVSPFKPQRPDSLAPNTLKSWLYTLYNNLGACAVLKDGHPSLDSWLAEFHHKWTLGSIFLVPPRYPENCGARIQDPRCSPWQLAVKPHYHVYTTDPTKPSGVWSFRRLSAVSKDRPDIEEPYYQRWLKGHSTMPREWRHENVLRDVSASPAFNGRVPLRRGTRYTSQDAEVHQWTYSYPDEGAASVTYWRFFPIEIG